MDAVTESALRVESEARRQIAFLRSRPSNLATAYQLLFYQYVAENSHDLIEYVLNQRHISIKGDQ